MNDVVLAWLASTSVQVAVLVVLVLAIQRLFGRHLTPRWRYGLWLVVVARLVLPVVPAVPGGGIERGVHALWSDPALPQRAPISTPALPAVAPVGRAPSLRGDAAKTVVEPAVEPAEEAADGTTDPAIGTEPVLDPVAITRPRFRVHAVTTPGVDWAAVAVGAWLAVAAALLGLAFVRTLRFRRVLARAVPIDEPNLVALLDECRVRMGVRRPVRLVASSSVAAPAVTGIRRPQLLLPPGVYEALDERELRHVFLHELAHVKRRDLLFGAVAHVLGCIYWFHPLVWVALRRLRISRELARDWEALRADPFPAPVSYARTLLKLCEARVTRPIPALGLWSALWRARELERRILMIKDFNTPARSVPLLGAALFVVIGWAGFTANAQGPAANAANGTAQPTPQDKLAKIEVERHQRAPAWRRDLMAKLDAPLSVEFDRLPASEAFAALRAVTGVNIVVEAARLDDAGDPEISLHLADAPLAEVLELVCRRVSEDVHYCVAQEAIFVGDRMRQPSCELRFYKIAPFFENEDLEDLSDRLVELVREYASPGQQWTWDAEGASMELWNGLLVVSQTPKMHGRVEALLNRLLNRGAQPAQKVPAWRQQLTEALAAPSGIKAQSAALADVAAELSARHGVTVQVDEDQRDAEVSLELDNVSLGTTLGWIADLTSLGVRLDGGVILLAEPRPELSLEFFEMGSLYGASRFADMDDVQSSVADMIRNRIEPEIWDDVGAGIVFWKDMMLVYGTKTAHGQVRELLAALERAFGG